MTKSSIARNDRLAVLRTDSADRCSARSPSADDADLFQSQRRLSWVSEPRAIVREQWFTSAAMLAALAAVAPVAYDSTEMALRNALDGAYGALLGNILVLILTALLAYGSTVYLAARMGHLKRLAAGGVCTEPPDSLLDDEGDEDDSSIVALVPSYGEEPRMVLRTLISAALQPHSHRVVLLIDDPPEDPPRPSLMAARGLPGLVSEMLRPMRDECERALSSFQKLIDSNQALDTEAESRKLAYLYGQAAAWFEAQTRLYSITDTIDEFFVELTFRTQSFRWKCAADRWSLLADDPRASVSPDQLRRGYQRLLNVFRVDITSFERKQFVNLSHAPNKAMNINSYLGLLGGNYSYEQTDGSQRLLRCSGPASADLIIPDAEFVLILDADTIVSPDYTLKLLRRFRQPGGERLALAQSPYSTFPATNSGVVQRIAGAQTDVQRLVHQGLTYYDATYWVGANALVRMAALRDLAERSAERGHEIVKFIRDRTLLEDTDSTLDLLRKGWRLFNEPERLAFSMTPRDFGSLLIQRRRWANGGLLIVPKLLAYLCQPEHIAQRAKQGFMRLHYLISLGPVSMALLVALSISFDNEVRLFFLAGTGFVYYTTYARDLYLIGYGWQDIFRVFALNLVLIPVNLVGMVLSIMQGMTGRKSSFGRTPKIEERTIVPAGYLLAEYALLAIWCVHSISALVTSGPLGAGFMALHAVTLAYGIGAFIGYRHSAADLAGMFVGCLSSDRWRRMGWSVR